MSFILNTLSGKKTSNIYFKDTKPLTLELSSSTPIPKSENI
jgi:hypothetical protein